MQTKIIIYTSFSCLATLIMNINGYDHVISTLFLCTWNAGETHRPQEHWAPDVEREQSNTAVATSQQYHNYNTIITTLHPYL